MDYENALEWLYRQLPMFSRTGAAAYKPGLDNTLELDRLFDAPHRKFRSIHVAGTNGKGSVSHNLASILHEQGYKTGLYTSPHLVDFRERIRVNGEMIPREAVISFVKRFRRMETTLKPSFFELTMMMAFDWFAKAGVDIAVIEVGMGGRLDSTNIISPIGCVITNISKDHTQFLGSTLEEIAVEKAGIIKPSIPVVIGEAKGDVRQVFEKRASTVGASIRFASDSPVIGSEIDTSEFVDIYGHRFSSPLQGDYQRKNLNTVLSAVEMLRHDCGIELTYENVRNGIANICENTHLVGRWTIIRRSPLAIADTGHNVAGLECNFNQLRKMMQSGKYDRLRLLLGFVADKDIDSILRLIPQEAELYLTQASIPRALEVNELANKCRKAGIKVADKKMTISVEEGWKLMLSDANANDLLYVGGSTFVVADLLSALNHNAL